MTARPAVSVVVPFFNAQRTLDEALACVAAQTFSDWELLLVDDGSTDAGPRIASAWARRDLRISRLAHPGGRRQGAFASRLLAARRARAPLVALLDADDLWEPPYLDGHLRVWRRMARPGLALSYGPARYWFPAGGDFIHAMPCAGERVYAPGELLRNYLSSGYATVPRTSCALLRRDAMLALARLAPAARRYPLYEDQFLMWGASIRWAVAAHPNVWVRYRQRTALKARPGAYYQDTLRDELGFLPAIRRYLSRRLPGHSLLEPGGIAARLADLRAPGRRTPFGDYFFERIPEDLRRLARASA